MQLILVLAVLMMLGGKSEKSPHSQLSGSDMLEMLKYISGDNGEMDKIIKEAEQVTEIINAIVPLATAFSAKDDDIESSSDTTPSRDIGLILQPVANIADDSIYNALAHAM